MILVQSYADDKINLLSNNFSCIQSLNTVWQRVLLLSQSVVIILPETNSTHSEWLQRDHPPWCLSVFPQPWLAFIPLVWQVVEKRAQGQWQMTLSLRRLKLRRESKTQSSFTWSQCVQKPLLEDHWSYSLKARYTDMNLTFCHCVKPFNTPSRLIHI